MSFYANLTIASGYRAATRSSWPPALTGPPSRTKSSAYQFRNAGPDDYALARWATRCTFHGCHRLAADPRRRRRAAAPSVDAINNLFVYEGRPLNSGGDGRTAALTLEPHRGIRHRRRYLLRPPRRRRSPPGPSIGLVPRQPGLGPPGVRLQPDTRAPAESRSINHRGTSASPSAPASPGHRTTGATDRGAVVCHGVRARGLPSSAGQRCRVYHQHRPPARHARPIGKAAAARQPLSDRQRRHVRVPHRLYGDRCRPRCSAAASYEYRYSYTGSRASHAPA
jgi:hypothetical protein